jgi:phosphate acetyltransferase
MSIPKCQSRKSEDFEGAIVQGPFAIDGALRPQAAEIKHDNRIVAGQADILVVPEIVAGNILTKGWEEVGVPWAGVVTGGKVPLAVTSQGDLTSEIKVCSVALATILFHRQRNKTIIPS